MSETTEVKGQFGLDQSGGPGKILKIILYFSDMFKTPALSNNQKKLQLLNGITTLHDFVCCCDNPLIHTSQILLQQLSKEASKEDKNQLIKCLGHTTEEGHGPEEDILGDVDLEALFAEDTGEDTTG